MRSNLDCEATTASERVLTLVSPSPPMSEAHRGGGEGKPAKEKGWGAVLLTPVTLFTVVLPSVTTRYCYESNNND